MGNLSFITESVVRRVKRMQIVGLSIGLAAAIVFVCSASAGIAFAATDDGPADDSKSVSASSSSSMLAADPDASEVDVEPMGAGAC